MLMNFIQQLFPTKYIIVSSEKNVYLEIYGLNTKLYFSDEMGICEQK